MLHSRPLNCGVPRPRCSAPVNPQPPTSSPHTPLLSCKDQQPIPLGAGYSTIITIIRNPQNLIRIIQAPTLFRGLKPKPCPRRDSGVAASGRWQPCYPDRRGCFRRDSVGVLACGVEYRFLRLEASILGKIVMVGASKR